MFTEHFDQWMKMNKNVTLPLQELNKTLTEVCTQVAQQNAELISENLARLATQFKRLSTIKKPDEFFNLQRDSLSENMSASIESMQRMLQISLTSMEQITKIFTPFTDSMQQTLVKEAKHAEREKGSHR